MFPVFSDHYEPDTANGDFVLMSKFLNCMSIGVVHSDGPNLQSSKLCLGIFLTSVVCSVYQFVCCIFLFGAPPKVLKAVVKSVPIRKVSAFHVCWARSDERLKNELVYINHSAVIDASVSYTNEEVLSSTSSSVLFKYLPLVSDNWKSTFLRRGPHRPVVPHAVAGEPEEVQSPITNVCFGVVGKARMNPGHIATSNSVVMGPAGVDGTRSVPPILLIPQRICV